MLLRRRERARALTASGKGPCSYGVGKGPVLSWRRERARALTASGKGPCSYSVGKGPVLLRRLERARALIASGKGPCSYGVWKGPVLLRRRERARALIASGKGPCSYSVWCQFWYQATTSYNLFLYEIYIQSYLPGTNTACPRDFWPDTRQSNKRARAVRKNNSDCDLMTL